MKQIFKAGGSLIIKLIVVSIMSFILFMSINVLMVAAFTKDIGYTATVVDESGKKVASYTYRNDDGEDKLLEKYTKKGYKVNKIAERSELSGKGEVLNVVLSQGFSFIMLLVFVYSPLFTLGNKEGNLIRSGHLKEDKLKGFKIGLVSVIPYFALFAASVICALGANKNLTSAILTLPMCVFFYIMRGILGGAAVVGDVSVLQFISVFAVILVVPIIAGVSYILGIKDILLFDKFIYKKKK